MGMTKKSERERERDNFCVVWCAPSPDSVVVAREGIESADFNPARAQLFSRVCVCECVCVEECVWWCFHVCLCCVYACMCVCPRRRSTCMLVM